MRKLELKDVAGYLPYGLKCHAMGEINEDNSPILHKLTGLDIDGCDIFADIIPCNDDTFSSSVALEDVYPILRPMTDITKKIVVEGYNENKPFIPSSVIRESFNPTEQNDVFVATDGIINEYCYLRYEEITSSIDLLNQWHFDYRGLIQKGLAIDINTIKE